MAAYTEHRIMIAALLLVYNSVTAVDEYCIEKPWECCDGDSTVKPGKFFVIGLISIYSLQINTLLLGCTLCEVNNFIPMAITPTICMMMLAKFLPCVTSGVQKR